MPGQNTTNRNRIQTFRYQKLSENIKNTEPSLNIFFTGRGSYIRDWALVNFLPLIY